MKFDELAILLTCHAFQDFPTHSTGADAQGLLAAWTALWHPALIANAGRMPTWHRLDSLPTADQARLLIWPTAESAPYVEPAALAETVQAAGGRLIVQETERSRILQQALADWWDPDSLDAELTADFLALGYAYLQVELLTRRMRYATRTAETAFADTLVAAAQAAVQQDGQQARTLLQTCFDFLAQERDHYYAVDVYLLDLALVAEPLWGEPLQRHLRTATRTNLLLDASQLPEIQAREPASWVSLQAAVAEGRVGLIGGEWRELPTSLVSSLTLQHQLTRGRNAFQELLGIRPQTFGRRTFGLASCWPQLLLHAGYRGALHATFDGGRFPEATQAKSRWEGNGQFSLDAIMRAPADATLPETFLNLAVKLSESMDMDHIATRCLVHWAGSASPWLEDLQRVTRYTRALGKLVTADEYFQDTYDPGIHQRCDANQYRSPYLEQVVAAGQTRPLSRFTAYWRRLAELQTDANTAALAAMLSPSAMTRSRYEQTRRDLEQFQDNPLADAFSLSQTAPSSPPSSLSESLRALGDGLGLLASRGENHAAAASGPVTGEWLVNPESFPRRVLLTPCQVMPTVESPVYAVDDRGAAPQVVVDVPACGVAVVRPRTKPSASGKPLPPMAENHLLRNEFLEVTVDPRSGGLRTFRAYGSRTNRLSQQLVFRCPTSEYRSLGPGGVPLDSHMVADEIAVLAADTVQGIIRSQGRLIDPANQEPLARFVQTMRLERGSRVLGLKLELEPLRDLTDDVWNSYFACRFAWSSEATELSRSLHDVRIPATTKRFEAPLFVELDDGQDRTAILTGGLPFHRRAGTRMLDTLLIVRGETATRFELGVGLDLKQPFREAWNMLVPVPRDTLRGSISALTATWLFHLDVRNVLTTDWRPCWDHDRLTGVRLRLSELEGRTTTATLRSFRPFHAARKIDGDGQTVERCEIQDDQIRVKLSPQEIVELEATWEN